MKKFQDISIKELNLKNQYNEKFFDDIDASYQFIKDNNLNEKVLKAEDLNQLSQSINKLENKYYDDFINVLKNNNVKYQNIIDAFNVSDFSKDKMYIANNLVIYNKEIYYCYKNSPQGTLPTNSNYWKKLGLKGEEGAKDLGIKFKGTWNNTTNYSKFDMVVFQNKLYVSKSNNKNKQPDVNLNEWTLQMEVSSSKITVQKTTPTLNNNELWFQLL